MNNVGVVLQTGMTLFLLWILYYWGIKPYRLDRLRHELFELRNELFLYAADGNISFDNYAYYLLRNRINALVRYMHRITFVRVALLSDEMKPRVQEEKAKFFGELDKLPESQQEKLNSIQNRVYLAIAKQMIWNAPPLVVLSLLYVVGKKVKTRFSRRPVDTFKVSVSGAVNRLHVDMIQQQAVQAQHAEEKELELAHA